MAALLAAVVWLALAGEASAEASVEARLDRSRVEAGDVVVLDVEIRDASGNVEEPDLILPSGLSVLASNRAQNFSWVNGRSSSAVVFRYEIGANEPGRYTIGPLRVRIGTQTFQSGVLSLVALPPRGSVGAAAALRVDVQPRSPYIGQPVLLRARLIQRVDFAETPGFSAPATPGFWAERYAPSESYYEPGTNGRVLITETRARLYPLSAGRNTIGESVAEVVIAGSGRLGSGGFGGGRRALRLRSEPLPVSVRPLPAGAPPGFDGAVGQFDVSWNIDRRETPVDVPLTLRLDVRGQGNLPLLHTPPFSLPGFEVFAGTVEDSLGPPGVLGVGRRRFQWTLLAAREGSHSIAPPRFSWFDPVRAEYRVFEASPLSLRALAPVYGDAAGQEGFPAVFREHRADPGARLAWPWAWAIAGLAFGAGWWLSRRGSLPQERAALASQKEWLRAIGLARGPDFWHAADHASQYLETRGVPVSGLRQEIDAARYGGAFAAEDRVRRQLVERLGVGLDVERGRLPWRLLGLALMAGALGLAWVTGPQRGDERPRLESFRADGFAEKGDAARAAPVWADLWARGERDAAIAARLAWASIEAGDAGGAAAWVIRGWRGDSRDPALTWIAERVREAGGLTGAERGRLPVRAVEWALLAGVLSALAAAAWPRRLRASAWLLLSALVAAWPAYELWRTDPSPLAVTRSEVHLDGADLDLHAGQLLRVESVKDGVAHVRIGGTILGELPDSALVRVAEIR